MLFLKGEYGMEYRHKINDEQWEKIKDHLPGKDGDVNPDTPIIETLYQTPVSANVRGKIEFRPDAAVDETLGGGAAIIAGASRFWPCNCAISPLARFNSRSSFTVSAIARL